MLNPASPVSTANSPPRKLAAPGLSLWRAVMEMYELDDPGGVELLLQACEASDRVARLAARIDADGEIVEGRNGPRTHPALQQELAGRAFICRTLERLGLNLEAIKPLGRPAGAAWKAKKDRANAEH